MTRNLARNKQNGVRDYWRNSYKSRDKIIYLFIYLSTLQHACVQITDKYSFVYSYYKHAEGTLATGASILIIYYC